MLNSICRYEYCKNIMDEGSPRYIGTYVGGASQPHVKNIIEQSDCLIGVGARFTDVGSAVFTHQIETKNYIEIKSYGLNIFGQDFPGIEIGQLLVELNKKLRHVNRQYLFLKNNLRK